MRLLPPISPTDACCTVLAQGCGPPSFEKEIAAVTGHTALKEVARYTGVADPDAVGAHCGQCNTPPDKTI